MQVQDRDHANQTGKVPGEYSLLWKVDSGEGWGTKASRDEHANDP